jgi:molybdopterin/thiamine biosynthesis adenylyltransferase
MTTGPDAPRYARHVAFPGVGKEGQARLLRSRATIVGAGALGASLAEQLVRSGVGFVRVVDRDVLEESNLGRQSLYTADDAARRLPKAVALAGHLRAFNPGVTIEPCVADLSAENADELLGDADVVVDGTDNLDTRYLVNDFCVRAKKPWVYGACVASRGMSAVILPGETPCLRCLYPEPPPPGSTETCETSGILAPAATLVASLQAVEVVKLLVGARDKVRRTWLSIELWPFRLFEFGGADPKPDPECPCCGAGEFPFVEGSTQPRTIKYCGRDAVQVIPARRATLDLAALAARLASVGRVERNEFLLVLEVPPHVLTVFADGRALVKGVKEPAEARSLYDRYVGS